MHLKNTIDSDFFAMASIACKIMRTQCIYLYSSNFNITQGYRVLKYLFQIPTCMQIPFNISGDFCIWIPPLYIAKLLLY